MWKRWAVSYAIGYVLRAEHAWDEAFNWTQLAVDAQAKAAEVVPGTWLDDEAKHVVAAVVDACRKAVADQDDQRKLLEQIAAGDGHGALLALKELLLKVALPGDIHAAVAAL